MIKIKNTSVQELSKDDFVTKSEYTQDVRFCGIKIWEVNNKVNNVLNDQNFKRSGNGNVGFGK